MNFTELREWIGREETATDTVTAAPVAALAATLDRANPASAAGDSLPPLWHWLYFLPVHRQSELSRDGHAERGGFLPPVPLPRRMWAGSQLQFHRPLALGAALSRTSVIADLSEKHGRSGHLVFVKVGHVIKDAAGPLVTEFHDIVYRDAPVAGTPAPAPVAARTDETWQRTIEPDEVLLFRYSALTFNGHRIHYDQPYVLKEEGYPGLVVHGPLLATLLLDLVERHAPGARVASFEFKALRPTFLGHHFEVCGAPGEEPSTLALWARDHEGWLTMSAVVRLAA